MAKSIETELREYFVGNINSRIDKLQEEIVALKRFKAKMLGRPPAAPTQAPKQKAKKVAVPRKKNTKKNIPWQHRPGNEARAAAWREKMSKVNSKNGGK